MCLTCLSEQPSDVSHGLVVAARDEGVDSGVGQHSGRVEEEFPPPDQSRLLTAIDDPLEVAREDLDPKSLPDADGTSVIGQLVVEGVAKVSLLGKVEASHPGLLPLRVEPFEEHHELQLEEDDRMNGGPAAIGA